MSFRTRIFFLLIVIHTPRTFSAPVSAISETASLATAHTFVSDDGSEIRVMPGINGVESVHCRLLKHQVIKASRHKTVSQIWYVLDGTGDIWLKDTSGKESITPLKKGVAITVPLGFAFQFRNTGTSNLDIFIVNTTQWSGAGELIPVANHWTPNVPSASPSSSK